MDVSPEDASSLFARPSEKGGLTILDLPSLEGIRERDLIEKIQVISHSRIKTNDLSSLELLRAEYRMAVVFLAQTLLMRIPSEFIGLEERIDSLEDFGKLFHRLTTHMDMREYSITAVAILKTILVINHVTQSPKVLALPECFSELLKKITEMRGSHWKHISEKNGTHIYRVTLDRTVVGTSEDISCTVSINDKSIESIILKLISNRKYVDVGDFDDLLRFFCAIPSTVSPDDRSKVIHYFNVHLYQNKGKFDMKGLFCNDTLVSELGTAVKPGDEKAGTHSEYRNGRIKGAVDLGITSQNVEAQFVELGATINEAGFSAHPFYDMAKRLTALSRLKTWTSMTDIVVCMERAREEMRDIDPSGNYPHERILNYLFFGKNDDAAHGCPEYGFVLPLALSERGDTIRYTDKINNENVAFITSDSWHSGLRIMIENYPPIIRHIQIRQISEYLASRLGEKKERALEKIENTRGLLTDFILLFNRLKGSGKERVEKVISILGQRA